MVTGRGGGLISFMLCEIMHWVVQYMQNIISFSAERISLFTSIRWSKSIELSTLQPLDLFPSLWHFHNGMHEQNQGKFPTALYPVRFITRTKIASSVPLSIETYFSIKHREKKNSENRRVAQMQRTLAKGDSVQFSIEECHGLCAKLSACSNQIW